MRSSSGGFYPESKAVGMSPPWDTRVRVLCEGCKWPRKTPRLVSEQTPSYSSERVRNGVAVTMRLLTSPGGSIDESVIVNRKDVGVFFSLCLSAVLSTLNCLLFGLPRRRASKYKMLPGSIIQGRGPGNITFGCLIPCTWF